MGRRGGAGLVGPGPGARCAGLARVRATVRITLGWTARRTELLQRDPALSSTVWALTAADRAADADQWRSMLFFRAVPGLFALVWAGLTVVALVLRR